MAKAKKEAVDDGKKGLEKTLSELNKKFGSGSLIGGGETPKDLETVPSGSFTLDLAMRCGGYPVGKLLEVQGPSSAGKSSLSLHAIANFQKMYPHRKVVLFDYEASLDYDYATALGVDMVNLIVAQPECAEDGYNMMVEVIKTGEISLIVIDSHTAALPRAVIDGDVGQQTIALSARVNSVGIGKIKPLLKPFKCTALFISQQRSNLGGYHVTQDSTGGKAFGFYADMRMKVNRRVDADAKRDEMNETTVEVFKNKCGKPFGKAVFNILWGRGIDRVGEIAQLAVDLEIIERAKASWLIITEDVKVNGLGQLRSFFIDNEEYYKEIEAKVLKKLEGGDD